jgi:hypothetical protein
MEPDMLRMLLVLAALGAAVILGVLVSAWRRVQR